MEEVPVASVAVSEEAGAEPIAVSGEEEEERLDDLIEEVEPEEIERDTNSNGDAMAAASLDVGDDDQELDDLLDGAANVLMCSVFTINSRGGCMLISSGSPDIV